VLATSAEPGPVVAEGPVVVSRNAAGPRV